MLNRKQVMQQLARTKNKKIEIIINNYDDDDAVDESGYPIENIGVSKTVYANVRSLRGKEFYQASQVQAQDDKVFYINYFNGLTAGDQIKYNGELYNIIAPPVNIDEANRELEVRARLVKQSG